MNDDVENPFGEPSNGDFLDEIESKSNFWNRTPQLQLIAWESARQEISPWGLLAALQQHHASHITPAHVLVRRDGSVGKSLLSGTSLSGYVGLAADTGGGKSVMFRAALELIPPSSMPVPDGTGQGLVKSIAETEKVSKENGNPVTPYHVTRFHRHTLVVHADEIDTLNGEFVREGTITAGVMRSMWSGATAGTTTGDISRRVTLPPNFYRIHGIWAAQPENAYGLMSDKQVRGGTPQRFLWAPCDEFRDPAPVRTAPPTGTEFKLPIWTTGNNKIGASGGQLPSEYRDGCEIPAATWVTWNSSPLLRQWYAAERAALKSAKSRNPYDTPTPEEEARRAKIKMSSHSILTTIKVAVWMAWLHQRPEPNDLDFELALVQMEVSRAEAAGVWLKSARAATRDAASRGVTRGVEAHASNAEQHRLQEQDARLLAEKIWHRLSKDPLTYTAIHRSLSGKSRGLLKSALAILESEQRITRGDHHLYWAMHNGNIIPASKSVQFRVV